MIAKKASTAYTYRKFTHRLAPSIRKKILNLFVDSLAPRARQESAIGMHQKPAIWQTAR
jgi:hypothetical protein